MTRKFDEHREYLRMLADNKMFRHSFDRVNLLKPTVELDEAAFKYNLNYEFHSIPNDDDRDYDPVIFLYSKADRRKKPAMLVLSWTLLDTEATGTTHLTINRANHITEYDAGVWRKED